MHTEVGALEKPLYWETNQSLEKRPAGMGDVKEGALLSLYSMMSWNSFLLITIVLTKSCL